MPHFPARLAPRMSTVAPHDRVYSPGATPVSLNVPSAATDAHPQNIITEHAGPARKPWASPTCRPTAARESTAVPETVAARPGISAKSLLLASWPTASVMRLALVTPVVPGKYVGAYAIT